MEKPKPARLADAGWFLLMGLLLALGAALLGGTASGWAMQLPTPTPAPAILLSPTSGPSGTRVLVRGYTFTPNDVVLLTWDGHVITPTLPSRVLVDTSGQFQAYFYVPTDDPGGHTITAGTAHHTASAIFTIATPGGAAQVTGTPEPTPRPTPTPETAIILTPNQGPPGTRVFIQGYNFTPNRSVFLKWDGVEGRINPETPITVLPNGYFEGYFRVPNDATYGIHQVEADDRTRSAAAPFNVIQATPTPTFTPSPTSPPPPTATTGPTNTPTMSPTVTPTPSQTPTWIPLTPGATWVPPTSTRIVYPTATRAPSTPAATRTPTATLAPGAPTYTPGPKPTQVPESGAGLSGPGGVILVGGAGLVLAVLLLVFRGLRAKSNL